MNAPRNTAVTYKWDARTWTGYRLLLDPNTPAHPYHVEDWNNHCIVQEWNCDNLTDAVDALNHLFSVDADEEVHELAERFGEDFHEAA